MSKNEHDRLGTFLTLILRHKPEVVAISLDENGWTDVAKLLDGVNQSGRKMDRELLEQIVATDSKGRFAFSEDGRRIRACQGHSVNVDMQFESREPPEFLYHGTASRFVDQIEREGLKPQQRQYVHLSRDRETAEQVGARHGTPVVFIVLAGKMNESGIPFFLSENNVWLCEHVPTEFLCLETTK